MASSLPSNSESLASISAAFKNFRQRSGLKRPVFPLALKRRALAFLEHGVKREELGRACGVSNHTITSWKTQTRQDPRKIVVEPEKEIDENNEEYKSCRDPIRPQIPSTVSFYLKSGISFELSRDDAFWLVSRLGEVQ
jgi:transposase-like protein